MLKIRLNRVGGRNKPFYSVILIDSKKPQNGKFKEKIGFYNPFSKSIFLKKNKIKYWVEKGARITNSVKKIIKWI